MGSCLRRVRPRRPEARRLLAYGNKELPSFKVYAEGSFTGM